MEKKKLIAEGKLDKYGRVNESTPNSWKTSFVDLSAVGTRNDQGASSSATAPLPNLISTTPVFTTPATSVEVLKPADEVTSTIKKVHDKINFL